MAGQPGDPDYVPPQGLAGTLTQRFGTPPMTVPAGWVGNAQDIVIPGTAPAPPPVRRAPVGLDETIAASNAVPHGGAGPAPKPEPPPNPTIRDAPPAPSAAVVPGAGTSGIPALPPGGWGSGGVAAAPARNQQTAATPYLEMLYGTKENPEGGAFGQQRKAYEGEKTAESILASADAAKHEREAEGLKGEESALFKGKEDMERQTAARKAKSDEWIARLDKESEKLANEKIEKPSTFDSVRWGIASMLGAVQQGFLHLKTNQIADQVQATIARDVERQKIEWERHKGRKEDLNTLYAKAYAASGDEMEATRLANGLGLEMAKKETQSLVASADSDTARARGDVLNAAIDMKKAQLAGAEAESEISHHKYTPATAGSSGPVLDEKALLKRMHELRDKAAEHGVDMSPQDARRQAVIEQTGRDPYAKYAGAAGTPLVGYAKTDKDKGVVPGTGADAQALAVIGKLPTHLQKPAIDEFTARKNAGAVVQQGNALFDKYRPGNDIGAFDRQRDIDKSNFILMIKPLTTGMSSDSDKADLAATMPQYGDSAETYAAKRQQFNNIIARNSQTPILSSVGVSPPDLQNPSNAAATAAAAGAKPVAR
jgi:hypothetical protein